MPITLDQLRESVLVGTRSYVELALGTVTPTAIVPPADAVINAFLDQAIGDALDDLGPYRASFAGVDDTDLAAVPDRLVPRLRVASRLRACEFLTGLLLLYDQSVGSTKQSLGGLLIELNGIIAFLRNRLRSLPGNSRAAGGGVATMIDPTTTPFRPYGSTWDDGLPRPTRCGYY